MSPPGVSTFERVVNVSEARWHHIARRRRILHWIVTLLLGAIIGVAVLDGFDVVDAVGPDERRVMATGGGYTLEVEYPSVTRPALASVFRVRVTREGGFDEPVQIAIERRYLETWDVNGTLPSPSSESALGEWIVWEFDPPAGDELLVTYEARIEPGLQGAAPGGAAVLVDDEPVVRVKFRTVARP